MNETARNHATARMVGEQVLWKELGQIADLLTH
jgi:hypothetical protein